MDQDKPNTEALGRGITGMKNGSSTMVRPVRVVTLTLIGRGEEGNQERRT
jgi:hypothetical protein